MEAAEVAKLRRALRDPAAWLPDDRGARGRYLVREHALGVVARAARAAGVAPLLVKGAALARSVYRDAPWRRDMGDVDLLVAEAGARRRMLEALVAAGGVAHRVAGRPITAEALGEIGCTLRVGGARVLVELHARLDKVVPRPVDYAAIARRARPAEDLPALLLPGDTDQALLVVLHATASERPHPVALVDLAALLRGGVDPAALVTRATSWRLRTALYVTLRALRALDASLVSPSTMAACRPPCWRRAALAMVGLRGPRAIVGPVASLPWLMRQAPLRDDAAGWLLGVARYAAGRVRERLPMPPPADGPAR